MAAAGVPLRTLQEWMGHRDFKTTLIYADYPPGEHDAEFVERAFGRGSNWGSKLSETEGNSEAPYRSGSQRGELSPFLLVVVQAVAGSNPVAHLSRSPR